MEQFCHGPFQTRLLHETTEGKKDKKVGRGIQRCIFECCLCCMKCCSAAGLGRKTDETMLAVEKKMR